MISSHDRSGYFGASDTSYIMGNWNTKTFAKWWLEKNNLTQNNFQNKYTLAGTYYEHEILKSLNIPKMEFDKQIIIENLKLRVNLDGNVENVIYECKTHKKDKFKVPKNYYQQVQVQMYAFKTTECYIVAYQMTEKEYNNFFLDIDKCRITLHKVNYDADFIKKYLARLSLLKECLIKGIFPKEGD